MADTGAGVALRSRHSTSRPLRMAFGRLVGSPSGAIGAAIVTFLVVAAVAGPMLTPYDPVGGALVDRLKGPSAEHWMGTDLQGRDELTRVLYGARVSLLIAILAVVLGFTLGCLVGALAATGRYADALLMRIVDVLLAFPSILLAIAVVAALGRGLPQIVVAIGVAQIGNYARLLRSRLILVKESDYALAARAVGVGPVRLMLRHLLPNAITPVLVYSPLALATAITSIAGLGFLGLGPPDPRSPEWGSMLTESARLLGTSPHLLFFPGLAIVLAVLGFNLLGDAAREAIDPRLRRSG